MFNENLRKFRQIKGFTIENLSEMMDVSLLTYGKWERGDTSPKANQLPKLALILDVEISSFWSNTESEQMVKPVSFNANLTASRLKKGITQSCLASLIGVSSRTYMDYENGKSEPNLTKLIKIAEALDLPINKLIYGSLTDGNVEKMERLSIVSRHLCKKGIIGNPDNNQDLETLTLSFLERLIN